MEQRHRTRLKIDCRKRIARDVLRDIAEGIRSRPQGNGGVVLVVENLQSLEGSVVGFLKDLTWQLAASGCRVAVIDRSGYATAFIDALGGVVPLQACRDEKDIVESKKILIVEDHEDNLELLRTLLESAGHSCVCARSVTEAIRQLASSRFDLVLLDLVLPDDDGRCVAQHILDEKKSIPVVAVSAYLDRWDDATYTRLHIRRRIAKPYRVKDILDAVRAG